MKKDLNLYLIILGLIIISLVSKAQAISSYTFTPIDVPSATSTRAAGINDSGNIVGYYEDATGTHGFLDVGGTFTNPIDVSGASNTWASGINSSGNIVGYYEDATGIHGFLDVGGTFTNPIDVSGASNTYPSGINSSGNIVGYYVDATGDHGFVASSVPEPSTLLLLGSGILWLTPLIRRFRKS